MPIRDALLVIFLNRHVTGMTEILKLSSNVMLWYVNQTKKAFGG
jgi:hypothetical protein